MKITCFIGVIGSGKDYQANKLVQEGYQQVNFADELYVQIGKILNLDLSSRAAREHFKKYYPNARIILQNYGQLRRKEDPEYWVKKFNNKLEEAKKNKFNLIVCSDVRQLNEVKFCLSLKNEIEDLRNGIYHFWYDIDFIFCNYISERYDANNKNISEKLAQRILKDGYKNNDKINHEYLEELIKNGV